MIQRITTITPDIEESISELGKEFYSQSGLKGTFRAQTFVETWNQLLKVGVSSMWISRSGGEVTGALGVILSMHMFDGEVTAQECFWFVREEHRGLAGPRLFKAMEEWTKQIGVTRILMAHLDQAEESAVGTFYERRGFRKLETTYVRDV